MPSSQYLRYYDERFGDTYEIYVDPTTGEFESAARSVEGIGRDPIYYDKLSELPPVARNAIENLILDWWTKPKTK